MTATAVIIGFILGIVFGAVLIGSGAYIMWLVLKDTIRKMSNGAVISGPGNLRDVVASALQKREPAVYVPEMTDEEASEKEHGSDLQARIKNLVAPPAKRQDEDDI